MRLQRIQLGNFRCFENVTIDELGDLNFFGGLNGSGKSTILDAISFALTGTCRGAEGGRGLDELRTNVDGKYTKHKASVTLTFGDGSGFLRTETEGPRSGLQHQLEERGVRPGAMRACLYAGELLRLPRKDAQALIVDLLPSQLVDVPPAIAALVAKYLALPPSKTADLPQLEQWHEAAYDRRREVGRLIKGLGELGAAPEPPTFMQKEHDPKEVRGITSEQLTALRRQRDSALAEAAQGETMKRRNTERLAEANDVLKEVQAGLLNAMTPTAIAARTTELLDELQRCEAVNKEREELRSKLQRELATHEGRRAIGEERLKSLRGLGAECPTCSSKLTATKKEKLEHEIKNSIATADGGVVKARQELGAVQDVKPLGELQRQIADLEGAEQRYIQLNKRHEQLVELIKKLDTALALPTSLAETAGLDERIAKGEARLAELDRYLALIGQHQRTAAELGAAQKEHADLEQLLQASGPGGLRTVLETGVGLDTFQGAIAVDMQRMGFTLDLGPLLRLEDDPHVNGRPARLLSASEQLRFSLAFAIAVATWSKLGLVCVDGWDALDDANAAAAGGVLSAHPELQRFVFTTPRKGMDAFMAVGFMHAADDPTRVFGVEAGKIVRYTRAA